MTKIQEKTKQNQSVFWILVHKALDKNDGQIFCLPVVYRKTADNGLVSRGGPAHHLTGALLID